MSSPEVSRNKIKLLPEHLIDQIKAGEVVERPASLIKELIENSLDAKATKIDIHLVENGMELIRIDDNGTGMCFEDLPFAFGRHATSKIDRYDDLFKLHSFGFRGEALASISSVSRITCTSTPIEEDLKGGKIAIHGGKTVSHVEFENYTHGTSFYIKDLFFNTPVRLKFLKSQTSEKNALLKIVHAFIISNPLVEFSLKIDNKEKTIFPIVKETQLDKRIQRLFFKKKDSLDELIEFEKEYDNYRVRGFLSRQSTAGYTGKKQYLFANNRFFQDKSLHQSVMRQAEKVWGPGRSGHYVLLFDVPPSKIDVNIHPNKIQIKFQESSLIYSLTNSSIKQALDKLKIDTVPSFNNHHQGSLDIQQGAPSSAGYYDSTVFDYSKSDTTSDEVQNNKAYQLLTSRFYSNKNPDDTTNIVDVNRLFIQYWIENIKSSPNIENILSPLLITEPFQIDESDIDKSFEFYRNIGFELERIDNKIVVLRTIPNYLNSSPYLQALKEILSRNKKDITNEWFFTELNNFVDDNNNLSFQFRDSQIEKFVNYFEIQFLIDRNILKKVDNSIISNFMQL